MKTREKTQKHSKTDTAGSCFFSRVLFLASLAPPPFPSASAPSFSIHQLLPSSRARRPAKSLSGLWIGPGGLAGAAESTTMPPAEQHLWFSHRCWSSGSATICMLWFPCCSKADTPPISHLQHFYVCAGRASNVSASLNSFFSHAKPLQQTW